MWKQKIKEFCTKYNIPLDYLPEIMQDPKVIPMIRGKAFEFIDFLKSLNNSSNIDLDNTDNLRNFAFNKIYVAKSNELAVSKTNLIKCSRKKCKNPENCGFIPNYPVMLFDLEEKQVLKPWVEITNCLSLLKTFL